MTTTATKNFEIALAPGMRLQLWRVSIGAGDTTAVWNTGLFNTQHISAMTQSDQAIGGVFLNSNNTTENSLAGSASINGLANSSVLDVLVLGN